MGRKLACQTSEPGSNPSWDTTVHLVCEIFNVMCVVRGLSQKSCLLFFLKSKNDARKIPAVVI